jgi:hypothetical protein
MNTMMKEAAKQMPHMMGEGMSGAMGQMMNNPLAQGAAMAGAGYAARGIVTRSLFANPLTLLVAGIAGGVAAGYVLHKYRKEIVLAVSKATGMSRDFALQQKENLADLLEEAKEQEAQSAQPAQPTPATPPAPESAAPGA